jgi:hypothetical protein
MVLTEVFSCSDITSIACEYNDANAPKKKRASPGSKVAALEAEIGASLFSAFSYFRLAA